MFGRFLFGLSVLAFPFAANAADVTGNITARDVNKIPKITVERLKEKLDKGKRVVIVDSRTVTSWDSSKVKIKGAIRILLKDTARLAAAKIPMGHEIVTYCT